jgi:Mg2+ and Co2+ transporter CorA
MIRSLVFTTQGRLHSKDIDMFLMPTLLSDTNLFLWVDLESPTTEETRYLLEDVFHFHPLSIEDCVMASPSPKVDEYYRDVYDALFHISELAQGYTDTLTGILQVYLNMSSNHTGEVVKLLTMITVITTPLMMVGTWYGMNFKHMPELDWRYGYTAALALTLLSTFATYWYFRRKKWF